VTRVVPLAAALLFAWSGVAEGEAVYWTRAALLKELFADCDRVSYQQVELDDAALERATARLGYKPRATWTVYHGLKDGAVQGYAVLDEELGQHQPISFAVATDSAGVFARMEIMVYREPYGDEVRQKRFSAQFRGKKAPDAPTLRAEVDAVSGATISSKAMASGIERALVIIDEGVIRPARAHAAVTGGR
jgi:Na+-translocating ferredoxin:NAD+ oxidoreductase RnfG subunit